MKKIIVLSLLAVMLTGCVKQADYDALQKKYDKLEKKYEDLEQENKELEQKVESLQNTNAPKTNNSPKNESNIETSASNFFTIDDLTKDYENKDTGETVVFSTSTNFQQNPDCFIVYTLPYIEGDTPTDYELKITWLVTEMDDFFADKYFNNYTIYVYTPQGIDRDVTSIMFDGTNYGVSGQDRDGTDADDPDWFIDACVDISKNGYDNEWLVSTTENMKSEINSCIHYH